MPTHKAEEFCKAFNTWAEACQTELPTDDEGMKQWRKVSPTIGVLSR
jgi:hypothetical protein